MDTGDIIYLILALLAVLASAFTKNKRKKQDILDEGNRMPGNDPFFPDWDEEEPSTHEEPQGPEITSTQEQQWEAEWEKDYFPSRPSTAVIPPSPSTPIETEREEKSEKGTSLKKKEISNGIKSQFRDKGLCLVSTKKNQKTCPIIKKIKNPQTLRDAIIFSEILKTKRF